MATLRNPAVVLVAGCGHLDAVREHIEGIVPLGVKVRTTAPLSRVQDPAGTEVVLLWLERPEGTDFDPCAHASFLRMLDLFADSGRLVVCCSRAFPNYHRIRDVCWRHGVPWSSHMEVCQVHVLYRLGIHVQERPTADRAGPVSVPVSVKRRTARCEPGRYLYPRVEEDDEDDDDDDESGLSVQAASDEDWDPNSQS